MRYRVFAAALLFASPLARVQFPPQIKNIVVIVQENRTPDNRFHYLTPRAHCRPTLTRCTPVPRPR